MQGGFSIILLLGVQAALQAEPPLGYYDSAEGKLGANLRSTLHAIIRNHDPLPYSGSRHPNTADALRVLDEDPAITNNVIGIYSGYSIAETNIGSASGTWNREHLWPQSYGTSSGPARTDLHHIRPEQANVNSSRGNNYYDESDPDASGYQSYENPSAGLTWSRTTRTWEPPDSVKGDVARALLYMAVRYTGDVANEPKLTLTDRTDHIVSGNTVMGHYTTLLNWHFADPVSPAEEARNDAVYSFQANRNPFIDRPEWVSAAFIPTLIITRSGREISLCWTDDYAPSVAVEECTALAYDWLQITNAPTLTTTNSWALSLPLETEPHFFRLRLE